MLMQSLRRTGCQEALPVENRDEITCKLLMKLRCLGYDGSVDLSALIAVCLSLHDDAGSWVQRHQILHQEIQWTFSEIIKRLQGFSLLSSFCEQNIQKDWNRESIFCGTLKMLFSESLVNFRCSGFVVSMYLDQRFWLPLNRETLRKSSKHLKYSTQKPWHLSTKIPVHVMFFQGLLELYRRPAEVNSPSLSFWEKIDNSRRPLHNTGKHSFDLWRSWDCSHHLCRPKLGDDAELSETRRNCWNCWKRWTVGSAKMVLGR